MTPFRLLMYLALTFTFVVAACEDSSSSSLDGEPDQGLTPPNPEEIQKIDEELALISRGIQLHKSMACVACHSLDGKKLSGGTYVNMYGTNVELEDGTIVERDEEYLRRSILLPSIDVVKGYPDAMPRYDDKLDNQDLDALIALIKSVSEVEDDAEEESTTEEEGTP